MGAKYAVNDTLNAQLFLDSRIKIVNCLSGGAGETPFDRGKDSKIPENHSKTPKPKKPGVHPKNQKKPSLIFLSSLFLKMPTCPGKKMEENYRRNKQK